MGIEKAWLSCTLNKSMGVVEFKTTSIAKFKVRIKSWKTRSRRG
jgi:hypothetical protein